MWTEGAGGKQRAQVSRRPWDGGDHNALRLALKRRPVYTEIIINFNKLMEFTLLALLKNAALIHCRVSCLSFENFSFFPRNFLGRKARLVNITSQNKGCP